MTALATSARTLLPASHRLTRVEAVDERTTVLERTPLSVRVPGITRDIQVKIASERGEWEQAYQLAAANYRARGYEVASAKPLRFLPYHALPDTTTFVAKHDGQVVATLSLVVDNTLLGLPMESIYGPEVQALRNEGRRLGEVISLADNGLGVREFLQVFVTIVKLVMQCHVGQGGDTCVITVNPRHSAFYRKVFGFVPLGPCRSYAAVRDAPAEAYVLDGDLMRANVPSMHNDFGQALPPRALVRPMMPPDLVRRFARASTQTDPRQVEEILAYVARYGSLRRW